MSVRLRESGDAVSLSNDNLAELMKLSGEVASLRARERESDWAATNAKTLQEKLDELQDHLDKLEVDSSRGRFRVRTDWADQGKSSARGHVSTFDSAAKPPVFPETKKS